jgi:hypothetical protein
MQNELAVIKFLRDAGICGSRAAGKRISLRVLFA